MDPDRPGLLHRLGHADAVREPRRHVIDVYQAATQMTDESGQTYPCTINTLLDRALGPEGYYGVFTANMHTDTRPTRDRMRSSARRSPASVPVVSARQMLTWLDGKQCVDVQRRVSRTNNVVDFTIAQGTGATGIDALLPRQGSGGPLSSLTRGGTAVTFVVETIKGVEYATFPATAGTYAATYSLPPETTITASPAASTTSTSASFSFTANPATGATFQCSLDGAAFATCTSPRSHTGLALGTHTFQVRAVNAQGTDPTPAAVTWLITNTPPDTTLTSTPPAATTSTSASFSFTANPAIGATFQCSLDGAAYATCTSPRSLTGLAVGNHTFNVRAVNAGGTDATPATFAWTIRR